MVFGLGKNPTITEKTLAPRLQELREELTGLIESTTSSKVTTLTSLRKDVDELKKAQSKVGTKADEALQLGKKLESAQESHGKSQEKTNADVSSRLKRTEKQCDTLETKAAAAAAAANESLSTRVAELQEGLRQELQELEQRIQEQWDTQRSALEAAITELQSDHSDSGQLLGSTSSRLDACVENLTKTRASADRAEIQIDAMSRNMSTMQKRLNDEVDQMQASLKKHLEQTSQVLSDKTGGTDLRLVQLEEESLKLRNGISEVENSSCRRVEWVIKDALLHLQPPDPADTGFLHTSYFSPQFDACGAFGLQLELQVFRKPPDQMNQDISQMNGDCAVFLWACAGTYLAYRLSVGSHSSSTLERRFNGRVPYGTGRLCYFKDHVDSESGALQVSVDVLECIRDFQKEVDANASSAAQKDDVDELRAREQPASLIRTRRHMNYRTLELVMKEVERMKSRMVRHVEWRIKHASQLRQCFQKGEALCSPHFSAAGVENMQLLFYPQGYTGAGEAYCSIFLQAPAGCMLKCTLKAGKEKREVSHSFEASEAYGRTNFCRFEQSLDEGEDSILVAMDVEDAHQDTVLKVSQTGTLLQPGDARSLPEIEGAGGVESAVKLRRAPGRVPRDLEEVKVLPSMWAPKGVGHIGEAADGFVSFDKLDPNARKRPATTGNISRAGSPNAGHRGAMRNRPRTATGMCKSQSHTGIAQLTPLAGNVAVTAVAKRKP